MRPLLAACAVLAIGASSARADTQVLAMTFTCERGVQVPVVYVTPAEGPGVAVIQVEGGMYNLMQEISGSGARYGFPSDGSHYVWWTKGEGARLLWHDGTSSEESAIYEECVRAR